MRGGRKLIRPHGERFDERPDARRDLGEQRIGPRHSSVARDLLDLLHQLEGQTVVEDATRVMGRLKALFRARAIKTTGRW